MLRFLIVFMALLTLAPVAKSQTQSDSSDVYWEVVMPLSAAKDIDMKQCLLGSAKDSLVSKFIENTGSWKFRVDSIYFSGADASAFSLVSGFPKYEVEKGGSHAGEFRFIPKRVGVHTAVINIITQADTLQQSIQGEGVLPQLELTTKLLDFGEVEIGDERAILDTALIKNISGSPITINNVLQLGPDKTQFEIISGGGSFTLQGAESRKLSLKFKPVYGGRTSGQLGFEHNGAASPAVVQLFGTGIGGEVYISSDSAYAGEIRNIKLNLSKIKPLGLQALAGSFSATIKYQSTILYPMDKSIISEHSNDTTTLQISGPIPNDTVLFTIPMKAGLGSVEETSLELYDFKLYDKSGSDAGFEVDCYWGSFKLLGVCKEGGNRLIYPSGTAAIVSIRPNPASEELNITLNAIEAGDNYIIIYNSLGREVSRIKIDNQTFGENEIHVNTCDFSSGIYFIKYETPTWFEYGKVVIER